MNTSFILGQRVALTALEKRLHLEACYRWFNDQEITQHLLTDTLPISYEGEVKWFEGLNSKDTLMFAIQIENQHKYIGNVGLHYIDWIGRTARTVVIIGDKEEWGKGFGTEAKRLIVNYAFKGLNLHKLTAYVIGNNTRSVKMNLKCGFKEEGRLRAQVYRQGEYRDVIIFGLLREEWSHEYS